jgi:hypothetical protein
MPDDPKTVDLMPSEYRQTAGPQRKELFLARSWYWGVLVLVAIYALAFFTSDLRRTLTEFLQ